MTPSPGPKIDFFFSKNILIWQQATVDFVLARLKNSQV